MLRMILPAMRHNIMTQHVPSPSEVPSPIVLKRGLTEIGLERRIWQITSLPIELFDLLFALLNHFLILLLIQLLSGLFLGFGTPLGALLLLLAAGAAGGLCHFYRLFLVEQSVLYQVGYRFGAVLMVLADALQHSLLVVGDVIRWVFCLVVRGILLWRFHTFRGRVTRSTFMLHIRSTRLLILARCVPTEQFEHGGFRRSGSILHPEYFGLILYRR